MLPDHAGIGLKLLITAGLIIGLLIASGLLRTLASKLLHGISGDRPRFWTLQVFHMLTLAGIVVIIMAIWLRAGPQLAAVGGYIAAGLAIALQRVITAFAGYLIILRGNIFSVGDRITIGGVRGDVVALGFMQTTVMEMGQAPAEKGDAPSMWINGRQYTGRLVRVTNDKIFDTPIYNYTREWPFLWDEIMLPIAYGKEHEALEKIMLDVARKHTGEISEAATKALPELERKYFLSEEPSTEPRVFMQLTDNWIALSLRFIGNARGIRGLKDAMYRDILAALEAENIGIASGTYAIVEFPKVQVELTGGSDDQR